MENIQELNEEKWIAFNLYYDNLDLLLRDSLSTFFEKLSAEDTVQMVAFNRSWERGKNIVLLIKIINTANEKSIEELVRNEIGAFFKENPADEKPITYPINDWFLPFPNNHIEFNKQHYPDIMEVGGLEAYKAGEGIIPLSSNIILNLIQAYGEEWSPGNAIGPALQLQLVFIATFLDSKEELNAFYNYCFDNILNKIQGGISQEEVHGLINGLQETFNSQAEQLVGFAEYIIESVHDNDEFDEEWLNVWLENITEMKSEIISIIDKGEYAIPEGFEMAPDSMYSNQKLWPVLEYYIRAFNAQMGIQDAYELNLLFSLKSASNVELQGN